jgi:hypothetical protein
MLHDRVKIEGARRMREDPFFVDSEEAVSMDLRKPPSATVGICGIVAGARLRAVRVHVLTEDAVDLLHHPRGRSKFVAIASGSKRESSQRPVAASGQEGAPIDRRVRVASAATTLTFGVVARIVDLCHEVSAPRRAGARAERHAPSTRSIRASAIRLRGRNLRQEGDDGPSTVSASTILKGPDPRAAVAGDRALDEEPAANALEHPLTTVSARSAPS